MKIVNGTVIWPGEEVDVLMLLKEPAPERWEADDSLDPEAAEIILLRALDQNGEPTKEVVGIQIVGFLDFERWDNLPQLPLLWQIPGWEPLPLVELLRRQQKDLRQRVKRCKRPIPAPPRPS